MELLLEMRAPGNCGGIRTSRADRTTPNQTCLFANSVPDLALVPNAARARIFRRAEALGALTCMRSFTSQTGGSDGSLQCDDRRLAFL